MTGIDTRKAIESWGSGSKFLIGMGFIAISEDEKGKFISLATDEECNDDIRLDKKVHYG